jgi:hypothetical protein
MAGPASFAEFLPLVPLLTDPQFHGIDGPAFDVVIPSLPGYWVLRTTGPHRGDDPVDGTADGMR